MEFRPGRRWMGRIDRGADLWEWFASFGIRNAIHAGSISCIGALERSAYSFYNQRQKKYEDHHTRRPLEIASCQGNFSLKDGEPFPHVHIVLSDNAGTCVGGHLIPGCKVFLAEYQIEELLGTPLERHLDEAIGLPVWHPTDS